MFSFRRDSHRSQRCSGDGNHTDGRRSYEAARAEPGRRFDADRSARRRNACRSEYRERPDMGVASLVRLVLGLPSLRGRDADADTPAVVLDNHGSARRAASRQHRRASSQLMRCPTDLTRPGLYSSPYRHAPYLEPSIGGCATAGRKLAGVQMAMVVSSQRILYISESASTSSEIWITPMWPHRLCCRLSRPGIVRSQIHNNCGFGQARPSNGLRAIR